MENNQKKFPFKKALPINKIIDIDPTKT